MRTDFKNLTDFNKYFTTDEFCREWYEQQRWGANVTCPHCGSEKPYRTNRGFKCSNKDCHKKFSVTVGTIFENSKIGLKTWFLAMYLVSTSKKGVSSLQLAEQLGITQKSAWFVLSRIRTMLAENAPEKLTGTVEIDEVYIGGEEKNRHASKKLSKKSRDWHQHKTPMVGLLQRGGDVRLQVTEPGRINLAKIETFLDSNVDVGATVITDAHSAYSNLNKKFSAHGVVNHHLGEYVSGEYHTNSIEGFWAIMKRGIIGIYHNVSAKHLHRYCNEFSYRYNVRRSTGTERFEGAILRAGSVRLTYKNLIA